MRNRSDRPYMFLSGIMVILTGMNSRKSKLTSLKESIERSTVSNNP